MNAMPSCCMDPNYTGDGREALRLHPSAAVRKRWDAELDDLLKSLDVDTLDTSWLTENAAARHPQARTSSPCPSTRPDIWELGGPLQYNTVHGSASGADLFQMSSHDDHVPVTAADIHRTELPNHQMPLAASPVRSVLLPQARPYSNTGTSSPAIAEAGHRLDIAAPRTLSTNLHHLHGHEFSPNAGRLLTDLNDGSQAIASTSAAMFEPAPDIDLQNMWPASCRHFRKTAASAMEDPTMMHMPVSHRAHAYETDVHLSQPLSPLRHSFPAYTALPRSRVPGTAGRTAHAMHVNDAVKQDHLTDYSPALPLGSLPMRSRALHASSVDMLPSYDDDGVGEEAVGLRRSTMMNSMRPKAHVHAAAKASAAVASGTPSYDPGAGAQAPQRVGLHELEPSSPKNPTVDPPECIEHSNTEPPAASAAGCDRQPAHDTNRSRPVKKQDIHVEHSPSADGDCQRQALAPVALQVRVRQASVEPVRHTLPARNADSQDKDVTEGTQLQTIVKLEHEATPPARPNTRGRTDSLEKSVEVSGSWASTSPSKQKLTAPLACATSGKTHTAAPTQAATRAGTVGSHRSRFRQAAAGTPRSVAYRAAKAKSASCKQPTPSLSSDVASEGSDDDSDASETPCGRKGSSPQADSKRASGRRCTGKEAAGRVNTIAGRPAPKSRQKHGAGPGAVVPVGKPAATWKFRGVTRKSNGRFEAQLHDHTARSGGSGKGDQVYLGVYVDAVKAAMAYDRAALMLFGKDAVLNFAESYYAGPEEERLRKVMTKQQYVAHIKSRSDADRGKSGYHGVAKRKNGRWQSRITGVACFGTFPNAEAAARAYDLAAIYLDGEDAVLNYPLPEYWDFTAKSLKPNLPWNVPESVLHAPPSSSRRKRQRGKAKKSSNDMNDMEEEILVKTSRSKKPRGIETKKRPQVKQEELSDLSRTPPK